jgi:hypothetical protein
MRQAAFLTRPERMQAVQTRMCFLAPLTTAFTRRRLGFHRRRVTLCAWLIVFPKDGFLPHISQTSAIVLVAPSPKVFKRCNPHATRDRFTRKAIRAERAANKGETQVSGNASKWGEGAA